MEKEKNHSTNPPKRHGGPMGRMPNEKAKDFKKSMQKLIKYLKPFTKKTLLAVSFAVLGSVLSIIGPNKISDLTNTIMQGIMTGIDMDAIKSIGLFLLIIYLLSAIFSYLQDYIMAVVTNKFSYKLRGEISSKINRLPLRYFDKSSIGDILSRVTNDVDTIGQTLNNSVASLVSSVVLFIGVLVMMLVTNWIMAITAVVATLVGFGLITVIMSKSQKYFDAQQEQLGKINGHIEEIYSGHTVVNLHNGVEKATREFDKINEKLFQSSRKSQFLSGLMMPIMSFIGNFGYVAVCIVGSVLVINGNITIGDIVAFMLYIRLFTQPLTNIAQGFTQLQSAVAASERVFEFLGEEELSDQKLQTKHLDKKDVKGNIEFENVQFGYNKEKLIIKNFSAKAKSGQKIAIVGPTGAGKTTMVNLLMKFYEIEKGDIKIDGISISELSRENIHDLFCMVLQDTWLFEASVRDNIAYNQKVSDEKIIKVCKEIELHHFIKTLPNGYKTLLNDTESISAGQKQLITIARGMIKDAPFLILDEATSNVDTRTEELVQKAMDKLTKGRTSFIIAHRLSTIKNADLILVMKDGNIIEQGNHKKLIKENGLYAELYNSQFQKI